MQLICFEAFPRPRIMTSSLSYKPNFRSRHKNKLQAAMSIPFGTSFLILLLGQLATQATGAGHASNVPFKTSFISSSDFLLRKSGASVSQPLSNIENAQLQPESHIINGPHFELAIDEQVAAAFAMLNRASQADQSEFMQLDLKGAESRRPAQEEPASGQQQQESAEIVDLSSNSAALPSSKSESPSQEDLIAAQSAESNNTVGSNGTNTTGSSSELSSLNTTSTTATQTTVSTTAVPETTTTPEASMNKTQVNSTLAIASMITEQTSRSPTSTTEEPKVEKNNTTTLGLPAEVSSSMSSVPTITTTGSPNTSPSAELISSTTTTTATSPAELKSTTLKEIQMIRKELEVGRAQSSRSSKIGEHLCELGEANCNYIIATVPLIDRWPMNNGTNTSRVVDEFVFLPEDSSLNFEESSYSTTVRPTRATANSKQDSELKAEHRTLDFDGNGNNHDNSDDIELDYISSESDLSYKNDDEAKSTKPIGKQPSSTTQMPLLSTARHVHESAATSAKSVALLTGANPTTTTTPISTQMPDANKSTNFPKQEVPLITTILASTSTTAYVESNKTTQSTSTTTSTTTPKPVTRVSQSTSFTVRVSSSSPTTSPIAGPGTKPAAINETVTTAVSPLPKNGNTRGASQQVGRLNQKLLRIGKSDQRLTTTAEPFPARQNVTSTTPRPDIVATTRKTSTLTNDQQTLKRNDFIDRRRNSKSWSRQSESQHKQYFNEPIGDQRRRSSNSSSSNGHLNNIYSPTANGADEEEAKILTRYLVPSQLTRLFSSARTSAEVSGTRTESRNVRWLNSRVSKNTVVAVTSTATATATTTTTAVPKLNEIIEYNRRPTQSREPAERHSSTRQAINQKPTRSKVEHWPIELAKEELDAIQRVSSNSTEREVAQIMNRSPIVERAIEGNRSEPAAVAPIDSITSLVGSTATSGVGHKNREPAQARVPTIISPTTTKSQPTTTAKATDLVPTNSQAEPQKATIGSEQKEIMTLISSSKLSDDLPLSKSNLIQSKSSPTLTGTSKPSSEEISTRMPALNATSRKQPNSKESRTMSTTRTPVRSIVDELDEYEGSVEDQLAKDALHSRHVANKPKQSNTYSRSSRTSNQQTIARQQSALAAADNSGKWQPDDNSQDLTDSSSASGGANLLPGRPGVDYPIHWQVPKTSFDCRNYELSGFYADVESDCQAYHSCHKGRGGRHTFLCPNGTLFSQELLTCDWWYNVECSASKLYLSPSSSTTFL